MVATIGALAAMSSAQVRAVEQLVMRDSIHDSDTLEFVINYEAPLFSDEFIHTPNYHTPVNRPQRPELKQSFRVPYKLDKGTPMNLSHSGRMYAMRMHGKDNRN